MGYNTRYKLNWSGSGPSYDRFVSDGAKEPFGDYELTPDDLYYDNYDEMKWYNYDTDMKALSKSWPTVLFELSGEGEESGDIWTAFYRNGKGVNVRAKIVVERPDVDAVLPLPEGADEAELEKRREEIRQQIERLQAELATV